VITVISCADEQTHSTTTEDMPQARADAWRRAHDEQSPACGPHTVTQIVEAFEISAEASTASASSDIGRKDHP